MNHGNVLNTCEKLPIMAMTYETVKLQEACTADQDIVNKLLIIAADGPAYGTPGPTNLNAQAKHAHVTNQTGVAWVYRGNPLGTDQHILALGKKSDRAGKGNSGYNWDKRGKI